MIKYGFEIKLNDEKLTRAGFDTDYYVISCMLDSMMRKDDDEKEISLTVTGLNSMTKNHVEWITKILQKGDVINIEIITDNFDLPSKVRVEDGDEVVLQQKIKYFYKLKEELKEHLKE
jgi:hypothetical protein